MSRSTPRANLSWHGNTRRDMSSELEFVTFLCLWEILLFLMPHGHYHLFVLWSSLIICRKSGPAVAVLASNLNSSSSNLWDWIDVKYPTLLHNWAAIKIQNIHHQIQSPVPGIINIRDRWINYVILVPSMKAIWLTHPFRKNFLSPNILIRVYVVFARIWWHRIWNLTRELCDRDSGW